jgi:predicted metal-dependent RNase
MSGLRTHEVKLSVFANDMILYLKDPEDSIKNLLDLVNTFENIARYKINIQKSVAFLYKNEQTEKDIRKIIPFTIT